jgi:CRISPR-associated protein Cas1
MPMSDVKRLFVKITRDSLPQVKDRYPFIYLERGRLEIDDSSVKWIDCDCNVVPLPVATLNMILLGPGTSVTHEAIKVATAANCLVSWVGEDSLLFYAAGFTPTANSRNLKLQIEAATNKKKSVRVAKAMFLRRFPNSELDGKSLKVMMGMEGHRIRGIYRKKAEEYQVGWKGRSFVPGKFALSDMTNKIITTTNSALYAIICSAVHSMGYSPHVGFIHSGSPLPFVYDLADLYKERLCIDLAFALTKDLAGQYNREKVSYAFRQRIVEEKILERIARDIPDLLGAANACSDCQ